MAKQIPITAAELMKLSIWKTKNQLAGARARGLLRLIRDEQGRQFYDLNKIDPRFLVKQTA